MRRWLLILAVLVLGLTVSACQVTTASTTSAPATHTLADLTGKTQAEIIVHFETINLSIQFREATSETVPAGTFIRYIGYNIGDTVPLGTTLRIELAKAPTVHTLPNLAGKTQAEILAQFESVNLTIQFEEAVSETIPAGTFIRYVGSNVGDTVALGTTIRIELAKAPPAVHTLTDLAGKTQAEIVAYFESIDLTIQFREANSTTIPVGTFIRYVGNNIGQDVILGTTILIEIAKLPPSAPIILGIEEATVYVAVQGNPPTFDLTEGVSATDYLGNNIPFGNFLYILKIENAQGQPVAQIDYYRVGVYTVTYQALNSSLFTTVERIVRVIVPPFDTNHTDLLRLSESYAGKSFINDGIGEVTVTTFTDADTTNFRDIVSGDRFTVRYLGIDAPEATSKYDPWGIKAASFVREILSGADKIILQAEGTARTDGNGRYLAWVWYVKNGVTRLLNLELVEQAYAWASGASNSALYGTTFIVAAAETQLTGRRVYGEIDPDYDYSKEGTPISIAELISDFNAYVAKKVTVTGVITSKVGNSVYLEQDGKGIYIYCGYVLTNELQIGHEVTIQGLVPAVYFESKQLSNYSEQNMQLLSTGNAVTITTILGNQMGQYVGRVVRFDDLLIQSVTKSDTNAAYTVVAKDAQNNTVNIRVDDYTASFLPMHLFVVGNRISVFGPVTQFYSTYQLMLPGTGNVEFK
jgi:beta-lactam-binding protein with PASTA domain/endonuclease YncB( thermonuclease family)